MRFLLIGFGVVLALVACGSSSGKSAPTATPAVPVNPASSSDKASDGADTVEALRQLAFDYWAAFNAYDADKTLSYLEADYRLKREKEIRGEIGQIKTFHIQLEVSEQIPPQMTGGDTAEMFLMMKEPLGLRRIQMSFLKLDGEWKLTYTEEVE